MWDPARIRSWLGDCTILASVVFALSLGGSAELPCFGITVANSSFEAPDVSAMPNGFEYNPTLAEQGGSGWSPSNAGGSGIVSNGGFTPGPMQNAPGGTQAGLIQQLGGLEQVLSFPAGSYQVSFYAEGRNAFDGANPFQVQVDGTPFNFTGIGTTITPVAGSTFQFYQSEPLVVASGNHTLRFLGTNAGQTGDRTTFIDLVSVTPEPGSMWLAAAIAGGLAVRRGKKRL